MEQVLYRLHVKILTTSCRFLSHEFRRALEYVCLFVGVCSLLTLGLLHITYVINSSSPKFNCLINALDNYQLYLQKHPPPSIESYSVDIRHPFSNYHAFAMKLSNHRLKEEEKDDPSLMMKFFHRLYDSKSQQLEQRCLEESITVNPISVNISEFSFQMKNEYSYVFSFEKAVLTLSQEVAPLLPLNQPKSIASSLELNVLEIEIDRTSKCFGPKLINRLVDLTRSLDVIFMNWAINAFDGQGFLYNTKSKELLNLNYARQYATKKGIQLHAMKSRRESITDSEGFLSLYLRLAMERVIAWSERTVFRSWIIALVDYLDGLFETIIDAVRSTTVFRFVISLILSSEGEQEISSESSHDLSLRLADKFQSYVLFRLGVIASTSFLFFLSSTLVSHILRETQERMVRFTFLLQYHVTHQLPLTELVFTHVTETLVFVPIMMGIYFFLFEFFSDQLLAFLVLLVVWVSEVFSILSLRAKTSIEYFPRLFLLYWFLFHIYFFSYPFGFAYLGLFTLFVFVFHSMMHFWNIYEVPAFESGMLSPAHPRIGRRISASEVPPLPARREIYAELSGALPHPHSGPDAPHTASGSDNRATGLDVRRECEGDVTLPGNASPDRSSGTNTANINSNSLPPNNSNNNSNNNNSSNSNINIGNNPNNTGNNNSNVNTSSASPQRDDSFSGARSSSGRFVITLPNIDVTRNNLTGSVTGSNTHSRRARSSTENDLSLELSQSSTGSHKPGLVESDSGHSRQRSMSNISTTSSNGSGGGISERWRQQFQACESAELKRMRLEQEKLKYNIHQSHRSSSSIGQQSNTSSTNNSAANSPSKPSQRETASPVTMKSSAPLSSSSTAGVVNPFEERSRFGRSANKEFPSLLSIQEEERKREMSVDSDQQQKKKRDVMSKDDLIDFFLEDLSPKEAEKYPRAPAAVDQQRAPGLSQEHTPPSSSAAGINKNYSFNVFGPILDDDS